MSKLDRFLLVFMVMLIIFDFISLFKVVGVSFVVYKLFTE